MCFNSTFFPTPPHPSKQNTHPLLHSPGGGGGGFFSPPRMTKPYTLEGLAGLKRSLNDANVAQLVATMRDMELFGRAAVVLFRLLCEATPRRRVLDLDRLIAQGGVAVLLLGASLPAEDTIDPSADPSHLNVVRSIFSLSSASSIKFLAEANLWNASTALNLPEHPTTPRVEATPWCVLDKQAVSVLELVSAVNVTQKMTEICKRLLQIRRDVYCTAAVPEPEEIPVQEHFIKRLVEIGVRLTDERAIGRFCETLIKLCVSSGDTVCSAALSLQGHDFCGHMVASLCNATTPDTAQLLLQLASTLSLMSARIQERFTEELGIMHVALELHASRFIGSTRFNPSRFKRSLGCSVLWILEKIGYVLEIHCDPTDDSDGYVSRISSLMSDLTCRCAEGCKIDEIMSYRQEETGVGGVLMLRRLFVKNAKFRVMVAKIFSELCLNASSARRDELAKELYLSSVFADCSTFISPKLIKSLDITSVQNSIEVVDCLSRVIGFVANHNQAASHELITANTLKFLQTCHSEFPESEVLTALLKEVTPLLPQSSVEDLLVQLETDFDESDGDPNATNTTLLSIDGTEGLTNTLASTSRRQNRSAGNFASSAVKIQAAEGWERQFIDACGFSTIFDVLSSETNRALMTPYGIQAAFNLCRLSLPGVEVEARKEAVSELWLAGGVHTIVALWKAHRSNALIAEGAAGLLLQCLAHDPTSVHSLRTAVCTTEVALLCQTDFVDFFANQSQHNKTSQLSKHINAAKLRQLLLSYTDVENITAILKNDATHDETVVAICQLYELVCLGRHEDRRKVRAKLRRCDTHVAVCKQLLSETHFTTGGSEKAVLVQTLLEMGAEFLADLDNALTAKVLHSAALHIQTPSAVSLAAGMFSVLAVDSIPSLCGQVELSQTPLYKASVHVLLEGSHDIADNPDWCVFLSICAEASSTAEQDLWKKGMRRIDQKSAEVFAKPYPF